MGLLLIAILSGIVWSIRSLLLPLFAKSSLDAVPGPPSKSCLFGNLPELFGTDAWTFHDDVSSGKYGYVVKFNGILGRKWLYVFDPTAMQSIIFRDQTAYERVKWLGRSNEVLLGPGLLSALGDTHRKQRKVIMPAFSAKHIRDLTPVFYEVTDKLVAAISERVADSPRDINILEWLSRTALEIVGRAGMGHSFDSLVSDDETSPFIKAAKDYPPLSFAPEMIVIRQILPFLSKLGPTWFRRWIVDHIPFARTQRLKEVVDTLHQTAVNIVEEKKAALKKGAYADGTVKDIMSILLEANMATDEEDRLPDDQIVGQINALMFAATDTTSHVLAQVLQLLAENPDIQAKVRGEIMDAGGAQHIPHDKLNSLSYFDAVWKETLRMYPPTPTVMREVSKDWTLPLSAPMRGNDGKLLDRIHVPKGTTIAVAVRACNRNKALWGDDADVWRPERWLKPLPTAVTEAPIPGVYPPLMSFSGGEGSCVGFAFAILEARVVLSNLLANFTFELAEKPIHWQCSAITFPTTGKDSLKPELWLRIGRYTG